MDLNTVPYIAFGSGSRILANWDPVIIQGYVIYFENKKLQKNLEKNYLLPPTHTPPPTHPMGNLHHTLTPHAETPTSQHLHTRKWQVWHYRLQHSENLNYVFAH